MSKRKRHKPDVRQADRVAQILGMDTAERKAFGRHIEDQKVHGNFGSGDEGDFTFDELLALGEEFLDEYRRDS
jgi:hypothetical protein